MSLNNKITQNCPHCNFEQELEYYQTVNITLQPELKNKVLSGKMNENICSNCKKEINIVSGFLYHDMKNQIMLELSMTDEEVNDEGKNKIIENMVTQGYIYRKVYEYEKLIEKINIFDSKLNDLVVEKVSNKMKNMLDESIKEVAEINDDFNFKVFFKKIETGLFKKKISFYCFSNPSQIMEMKYDIKNLETNEKDNLYNMEILRK
ncbi:CpXC domain-containing protein [Epilithonimonas sp. JDS]|uniref:CpXC domain-containing protein n=1 Tax=Epilithonimonas sp. JDS TaxID=2902797 RepID=UPI001E2D504D|nr:CpXC domain-containing protein [Epilithonimonas sp. JDS]MCD9853410.1 CpXC domain-containing protein [Epilithonimonas sp. JDS]